MNRYPWNALLMPPPDLGNPYFATPDENTPGLFDENAQSPMAPADADDREPLPPYVAQLFEVAGVPTSLDNGQVLQWSDVARTSARFVEARAQVDDRGAWIEFSLLWSSGRRQCMRTTRYLDVVALQDSSGLQGNEPVTLASGRLLADFRDAVQELMVRH